MVLRVYLQRRGRNLPYSSRTSAASWGFISVCPNYNGRHRETTDHACDSCFAEWLRRQQGQGQSQRWSWSVGLANLLGDGRMFIVRVCLMGSWRSWVSYFTLDTYIDMTVQLKGIFNALPGQKTSKLPLNSVLQLGVFSLRWILWSFGPVSGAGASLTSALLQNVLRKRCKYKCRRMI